MALRGFEDVFRPKGMQLDCNWRSVSHARTHGVKSLSVSLRDPLTVVCVCVRAPRGRATVHVRAPSSPTGHHGHAITRPGVCRGESRDAETARD